MKAVVLNRYCDPADLEVSEVDTPRPAEGEARIEIGATAVNDWEWCLVRGKPAYMRLLAGLLRPKVRIIGCDVAGRVEAVGPGVSRLRVGDDVYGDLSASGFGGFAELVCVPEGAVARMPRGLSYEEAAALPHAGLLARQALYDLGGIERARTLLVNGAGGGVGPLALAMARLHGLEVTGVDNSQKQSYLRELGFDHVLDYTREDFTRSGRRYDLVLDVKTTRSPFAYARALNPGGTYVTVGGSMLPLLLCAGLGKWIGRARGRHVRVLGLEPNRGLDELTKLVEAGEMKPSIDSVYPLTEVGAALERFGEARHRGKVVLRTSDLSRDR